MYSRLLLLGFAAVLIAACQVAPYRGDDLAYRCERIRGYEPGTPAFNDCLYDERLSRRDRYP